jgi:hypothetical protein
MGGLLVGVTLSYWYLTSLMAEKTTMKMFVFIPMWDFYEPTVTDYLLATAILLSGALVVYWTVVRLTGLLAKREPGPVT